MPTSTSDVGDANPTSSSTTSNGAANSATTTVVILVCGWETNGACAGEGTPLDEYGGVPLQPYRDAAVGQYEYFDFLDYATDSEHHRKQDVADAVVAYILSHSDYNYILVGHSAGADAVILALDDLQGRGNIGGVVLLDPTFSGTHNRISMEQSDYGSILGQQKTPIFLADGVGSGSDGINLAPYLPDNFVDSNEKYYRPYGEFDHLALAMDDQVFQQAASTIDFP